METQELHRGRLIDHIHLVVRDLAASRRFYEAVFQVLDIPDWRLGRGLFLGRRAVRLQRRQPGGSGQLTGRHHLAFQAKDRAMVDAFYKAGLDGGGKDNGAPGERPYHPGYYAAFLLDPDGNNIEAVYHGPAARSAASIKITF